ncbi:hypothetical protein TSUD_216980 [Trifolium subterraneum]|uniref:Uncharacterized protein n=1 Tax=Trifolium subterraneum TaxID=3900 RepID=A0A2Z6MPA4_TRISU|nr:hypothetical protein TSUD_216980 [Trifolium subterraneum]
MEHGCSPAYKHTRGLQFGLGVNDDVISLLSLRSSATVCALYDMHRLIQGEKEVKSEKPIKLRRGEIGI